MTTPRHIVIVGGGTAGWMAANLFVRRWQADAVKVTLLESPAIGTIGVGEGSTPTLKRFFELIGVDDADWMPHCAATYKVGIRFDGWSPASGRASYRHPFFSQPDSFTTNDFLTNCRTRRLGLDVNTQPDDFFLNGQLARQHRAPLTPENFPFDVDYGYHFDALLLGRFLAELGTSRGVRHIATRVTDVHITDGTIDAVTTVDAGRIDGDFFVDCTGFAGLLIQKSLGVPFKSFKNNLFNDAAVALPGPANDELPCETVSVAMSAGWCWHIPLTSRFGNGYVYSSDFIDADAAETELRRLVGDLDGCFDARHLKMRVGQLDRHWDNNCLAVGLAQGFIEPLEATALLLVQVSVELFMDAWEQAGFAADGRKAFNATITDRFERVRDYIVAHYKLNTRSDSEYWVAARDNNALSDSLRHMFDVWYRREDLSVEIQRQQLKSHFDTRSWHCLLAGYGTFPALAENQPNRGDLFVDKGVENFLAGCALNFESHAATLRAQPQRGLASMA
ncbi:MAG: tryptophan halogenase family protein [Pseudomonadota bacterium]